jgi:hypothetical protein
MSKTDSLHYQLCLEGAKWLHRRKRSDRCKDKPCHRPDLCWPCNRYDYVAVELNTYGAELTDVWGMGAGETAVIEVKVSRSDFLADRKKWGRSAEAESLGLQAGRYRWYLCPEGVIGPEELPEGWGLLWWDGKAVTPIAGPKAFEHTAKADMLILTSLIRRENFPKRIFNYRGAPTAVKPRTINGIPEREYLKTQKLINEPHMKEENENQNETGICEECGCEYEVNEVNSQAPYSMCDDCYDEYLIKREMARKEQNQ